MYTRKSQRTPASIKVRNFPSGDLNVGWRGPHISDDELVKLGSEAELLRVRVCTARYTRRRSPDLDQSPPVLCCVPSDIAYNLLN